MLVILSGIWMVVVKDNSGVVIHRESVGDKNRVVQIVSKYLSEGYEISVRKSDSNPGDVHPMTFVEGNTNVVTSINAGSGINVDNTDPANPVISLPSCADNQILMKSGGSWTCVDKGSVSGASGDYRSVTMMSSPSPDAMEWYQAFEYCENLVEGGYDDWRVPTGQEFIFYCVTHPSDADCKSQPYWLSTYYDVRPNVIMWYSDGNQYRVFDDPYYDNTYRVRCIR